MVIGDRNVMAIEHFSFVKKRLQRARQLGGAPGVGHRRSPTPRPASGPTTARRPSASPSCRSSPTRSSRSSRPARASSPSTTCRWAPTRRCASRGCSGRCGRYVRRNIVAIFRIYTGYEPLRVFTVLAAVLALGGAGRRGRRSCGTGSSTATAAATSSRSCSAACCSWPSVQVVRARRHRRPHRRPPDRVASARSSGCAASSCELGVEPSHYVRKPATEAVRRPPAPAEVRIEVPGAQDRDLVVATLGATADEA